ncbi:MAG: hypothetical protein LRY66_15690 [Saccharospirillaceae bacterium]|nr:hypothetical protein [Saccharospirillaceae bacterium]MCD8532749.1 hypothetical protein [Saccharospirillaceae bacterium]
MFLPHIAALSLLVLWWVLAIPAAMAEPNAPEAAELESHRSQAVSDATLVTPEWVERYLYTRNSDLLNDSFNDHVMSFYYFGRVGQRTLIGLERVRGNDYEQFFSLLIFHRTELLGYYRNVLSFPSGVSDSGDVQFPRGVNAHLQGSDALLNIHSPVFIALCQRQRGVQSLAELCVPWTPVHSQ